MNPIQFIQDRIDLPTTWDINSDFDFLNLSSDRLRVNHTSKIISTLCRITVKILRFSHGILWVYKKYYKLCDILQGCSQYDISRNSLTYL